MQHDVYLGDDRSFEACEQRIEGRVDITNEELY